MTPTEQQKAILECRENLVVIAAPGSGKTFVLSEKIKNDIKELLDYQGIIAISYTNKASLELKNRSLANGISPKSSFFGTIDKFCIQDIIIPFGSLMQEKKTFDNLIIRSMNNSERSQLGQVEKREKIEYNHMDIILSLLEANIILIECIGILANYIFDNSKACRSYLKSRYKYLYVDEYQDTGIDQHYLFIKLKNMGIIMAAVGDVNQSIFEFSGKKSYYLKRIRQDKTFRSFILSQNHRSHQSIVNYSNRLIDSTCTITDIPEKDRRVFYFISLGDEKHIASFIDEKIASIMNAYNIDKFNKIAILFRNSKNAQYISQELNTPHKIVSPTKLDMQISIWASIFASILRFIFNPTNRFIDIVETYSSFDSLRNTPKRSLQKSNIVLNGIVDHGEICNKDLFIEPSINIATILMPEAHNINDINLLKEVVFDSKQLDSYRSEDSNEINLMTLHKSKGLEFDAVIHADLYEWGLPSKKVENNNFKEPLYPNWEQDLNLHYVGITRAKKVCILIRSEKRHKSNGELTNAQDSEFIQLHNVHNLRFNPVNAIPFPTQRYMNEVKEKEFPRS